MWWFRCVALLYDPRLRKMFLNHPNLLLSLRNIQWVLLLSTRIFFWGHFRSFFRTRTLFPTFPPEIAQGFWLQLWGLRTLINPFVAEKPGKNWFFWNRTFWNRTTNYVQFPISKEGKIHKKTLAIHTMKLGENWFQVAYPLGKLAESSLRMTQFSRQYRTAARIKFCSLDVRKQERKVSDCVVTQEPAFLSFLVP